VRIALVHPYPWPEVRRGAERYLEDLCSYLAGRGHDVTIVTGTHDHAVRERRPDGASVVRRPLLHPRGARRLGVSELDLFGLSALRWLLGARVDLVHALVPAGALAGRLAGKPTLYTVLGHPTVDQLPPAALPRRLFTAAVRKATITAVLSRSSADALLATLGRQAVVLPPGVSLERFPPDLSPRRGATVLVSASLDDPRKRARLAVDAFVLLRSRRADARLVLSGSGDPGPLLARVPPELRAAVEVAGTGRPEDVPARYRRATVTLLASDHEAFGLALVESLASGTPVVCTPEGGMPEIVEPGVGTVARSASPEALAEALDATVALAADPATPRRCVERARHWSWESQVGPAHLAVYDELVGRPGP
jgi:glycosyltransferase involved in cell wall biosynthesis